MRTYLREGWEKCRSTKHKTVSQSSQPNQTNPPIASPCINHPTELQSREAAINKERDQARAQTTALIAAMANETGGKAAEGQKALEQRLNEFVDAVGIREEYEREVVGRTVVGEEGTDVWAAWYDQAFREVEGRMEAVGAAAEAAVEGMRGEVQGMKGQVEGMRREVEVRSFDCGMVGFSGWGGGRERGGGIARCLLVDHLHRFHNITYGTGGGAARAGGQGRGGGGGEAAGGVAEEGDQSGYRKRGGGGTCVVYVYVS